MKHIPQSFAWLALASGLFAPAVQGALRAPYTADSYTTHLYHFSEAAGTSLSANAGGAGFNVQTVDANPVAGATVTNVLGAAGLAGFLIRTGQHHRRIGFAMMMPCDVGRGGQLAGLEQLHRPILSRPARDRNHHRTNPRQPSMVTRSISEPPARN